jgi:Photosynthetic reaction centre cytochrome C subunit
MSRSVPSILLRSLFAVVPVLVTGAGFAQPPAQEEPKNLTVLPKDWSREQVVNVMRVFTAALGVDCEYCHVETENGPPDFASDDKEEKDMARAMMKITADLNARLPSDFGKPAAEVTRIQCITCHRGVPEPKQLAEILAKTSAEKGFAAASAEYMDLKSKYYGAQAYDFSENGLIATARPLVAKRADEALQFLALNLELFPRSAQTYVVMSQAQVAKNDKAGAISSLEKALDIDPQNGLARRTLNQLKAQ